MIYGILMVIIIALLLSVIGLLKQGFTQVIRGLESIDERLSRLAS